ncbi:MAG: porin family protein [Chlorobiaceae bacterium]|nr:porin family protein [Chlorobiaceae bacterium]
MFLLATALLHMPSCATAASQTYVSVTSGVGMMNDWDQNSSNNAITFKPGLTAYGALGLKNSMTRVEVSVGYQHNIVDTVTGAKLMNSDNSADFWTCMMNGYLDCRIKGTPVVPYIMAGTGFADIFLNDDTGSETHGAFAWQVGAGAGIDISENITLDLGYRYLSPSDITSKSGNRYSTSSGSIIASLRFAL